jgi:hypothetical protein
MWYQVYKLTRKAINKKPISRKSQDKFVNIDVYL